MWRFSKRFDVPARLSHHSDHYLAWPETHGHNLPFFKRTLWPANTNQSAGIALFALFALFLFTPPLLQDLKTIINSSRPSP